LGLGCGRARLFTNVATNSAPTFDLGHYLEVGPVGNKVSIDVGSSHVPAFVDWDNDGRRDLISGSSDGKLRYYRNEGTDAAADFRVVQYLSENGQQMYVPSGRSAPVITDVDGDGRKDLLTGNKNGQVLYYPNQGTDAAPVFRGFARVTSDGVPIVLAPFNGRSHPVLCDWTGDGLTDLLLTGSTKKVHLFQGVERIFSFCHGDGTALPCPCSNLGAPGEGCANSSGSGAKLSTTGTTSIGTGQLALVATGAIPGQTGLFFQGNGRVAGGNGLVLGDGLLCAGGNVMRLEVVVADQTGAAGTSIDIAARAGVAPGDIRYYQFYYRDSVGSPCQNGFNLTNGLGISWLP